MKHKKVFFIRLFVISFFLLSCQEIIDDQYRKKQLANYTSPYMGRWVGTYSGDSSGTLIFNVAKSGSTEIIRKSQNVEDVFYASVGDGGSFFVAPSPNSGFTVYGNLQSKAGTWKQQGMGGNWSVTKQ